ncbi:hypothetical protein [Hydrogenovibrio kuenenii]|uniref:hypothetical protein n=1 Tax=Hydrogenovibrio kuenenii TaxID=63658 RepID=UPI0004673CEF|nr:hypothetical protein [Hydrogenovibrio kuenenii]
MKKLSAIKPILGLTIFLIFGLLSGCSSTDSDPGPLKGKWHVTGIVDTVMTFRKGETETNKIVEKASYKVEPHKVLVTYESGMAKGMTQTYIFLDKDTVESPLGKMTRIK